MATYLPSSPYYSTSITDNDLDVLHLRNIPKADNDPFYTIAKEYEFRPDLLAFDLYGDVNLWWVFINRNPDLIKDPIFDFTAGTEIQVATKSTIETLLGT